MNLDAIFALVSVDIIILLCVSVVLALVALRLNVVIPATLVLSLFLTTVLLPLVNGTVFIGATFASSSPLIAFLVLFVLLAIIFFRLLTRHMREEATLTGALLSGAAGTVGIFAAWVQTPLLHSIHTFNPPLTAWFTAGTLLLWIFGSLIALGIAQRQSRWI